MARKSRTWPYRGCGDQFRRQLHRLRFQFLERLRHRMAMVKNHQVDNQMVVLDRMRGKPRPSEAVVEALWPLQY